MNNTKRSIKHYLMLPSYQLRLVLFLSLVVMLGFVIHGNFLNFIISKNLVEHFSQNQIEQIWDVIKPVVIIANSITFILMIVFLITLAILISHKLVGPMFKITGYINKINSGILPKKEISLREGDEGQLLCDAVNKLRNNIKEHHNRLSELKNSNLSKEEMSAKIDEMLESLEIE